jgi:diguanylate cyclase (GGDEF)-like protein/PAS domain S-box-containing protein
VLLATIFVGLVPEDNLIWVANGVLLAYLLLAPRKRWPAYICAGYAAQFAGGLLGGHHGILSAAILTLLNLSESLLSALLLRRRSAQLPDFTNPHYLTRFLAFGVLAGPAALGAIYSILPRFLRHASPGVAFLEWIASDSLGVCVATPACVAIFRARFRRSLYSPVHWAHLLPVVVCAVVAFSQARMPVPFLLYPLLVLVLLRLDLGWAALGSLIAVAIGSSFTVRGHGPFAVSASITALESAILVQLFIASAMVILYSVSVVIASLREAKRRIQEIAAMHKLVTENSRDVIIVADFDGNRSFVSAAGTVWGGWTHDELIGRKSLDLVHPEDRARMAVTVRDLHAGKDGALAEFRIKQRDDSYIWVEASLKTIRDPVTRIPLGILNSVRDITERKVAEQARRFQLSLIDAIHGVSLDGILVVDDKENVVSCNRRFGEVWQIPLPACLPGQLDQDTRMHDGGLLEQAVARTKDPEAFVKRVEELYANRDQDDHCQIELKDGRTLERYSTSLRDKVGQYLGRAWFFRDISDHKLAEQRLEEAYHAVETLAITDALTGLANRRRFDQCLAAEWRRGMRDGNPLSLLLIDVDWFKSYNDNYGHLNGDTCLKQIAGVAQSAAMRPGDLATRFGGEEFALILPKTRNDGALEVGEAICDALRARRLPHTGNPAGIITVSIGCATVTPQLGENPASLVDLADHALYKAKRRGRNRVCSSNPESLATDKQKTVSISAANSSRAT